MDSHRSHRKVTYPTFKDLSLSLLALYFTFWHWHFINFLSSLLFIDFLILPQSYGCLSKILNTFQDYYLTYFCNLDVISFYFFNIQFTLLYSKATCFFSMLLVLFDCILLTDFVLSMRSGWCFSWWEYNVGALLVIEDPTFVVVRWYSILYNVTTKPNMIEV